MKDNRSPYNFWERKDYENNFVKQNKTLILDLLGAESYLDLSESELDKFAGIDGVAKIGDYTVGIALRIRRPKYDKWKHNFTLGHHYDKSNSQVHKILNSLRTDVLSPNFILQINGVDDQGNCLECEAIKIQSEPFANYLTDLIENDALDSFYNQNIAAYEFSFRDAWYSTDTGVEYYYIEDNTIVTTLTNEAE